jgi:hypothetical protein
MEAVCTLSPEQQWTLKQQQQRNVLAKIRKYLPTVRPIHEGDHESDHDNDLESLLAEVEKMDLE